MQGVDSLKKHAQHENYQAAISKRCLHNNPGTPTPIGRGWKLVKKDDNEVQLVVDWMEGQPAPEAVLDLSACNCIRRCQLPTCVCCTNGLKCTDRCKLSHCENRRDTDSDEKISEDDAVDDEDVDDESE